MPMTRAPLARAALATSSKDRVRPVLETTTATSPGRVPSTMICWLESSWAPQGTPKQPNFLLRVADAHAGGATKLKNLDGARRL